MNNHDGVCYVAVAVADRLSERTVVEAKFRQYFAGTEVKVVYNVIALGRVRQVLRGKETKICKIVVQRDFISKYTRKLTLA